GERAVELEVDLAAGRGFALELLARDRDRGGPADELPLAFAQNVVAAQIVGDLAHDVTPAPRPRTAAVGLDERRSSVRHPRARAGRFGVNAERTSDDFQG